jgi:hypothetical protein
MQIRLRFNALLAVVNPKFQENASMASKLLFYTELLYWLTDAKKG